MKIQDLKTQRLHTSVFENNVNNHDSHESGHGQVVTTKKVTSGNRTIETITTKKEENGNKNLLYFIIYYKSYMNLPRQY